MVLECVVGVADEPLAMAAGVVGLVLAPSVGLPLPAADPAADLPALVLAAELPAPFVPLSGGVLSAAKDPPLGPGAGPVPEAGGIVAPLHGSRGRELPAVPRPSELPPISLACSVGPVAG
jgi:hypothetical protein